MDIDSDIDARLSAAAGQGQRERVEGYLSLLAELLSTKPVPVQALIKFGQHFTTSTTMAMVVGSRVLDALVAALCAGLQLDVDINDNGDKEKWTQLGKQAFDSEFLDSSLRLVSHGAIRDRVLFPEDAAVSPHRQLTYRRGRRGSEEGSHRGCAGAGSGRLV